MANVEELKAREKAELEVFDLESLIVDGSDALIPITIEFPTKNGNVEAGAMIKPVTSVDYNNAVRLAMEANDNTILLGELLELGLYTRSGDKFPEQLIEKMPAGVALKIAEEINRVSGIETDEAVNDKLVENLMGF